MAQPLTDEEKEECRTALQGIFDKLGVKTKGKVLVHPDQDSIKKPGQKTAISDPMDGVKYEAFLDELIEFWRYPVTPMEEILINPTCSVVEKGENSFEVKVVYEASKLRKFGHATGEDVIRTHYLCEYSYNERYFKSIDLGQDNTPKGGSETHFLENPLRIEFWIYDGMEKDAPCFGGPTMALYIQNCFVDPIIQKLHRRGFAVEAEAESLVDDGELSALSDGLDEYASYDEIFDGILEAQVEKYKKTGMVKENEKKELVCKFLPAAEDASQTEKDFAKNFCETIVYDKETGRIRFQTTMDRVNQVTHFVVHQLPLRVEYWVIDEHGDRQASKPYARVLRSALDDIVKGKESGWFW